MMHNDVLRSVRYMLDLRDEKMLEILISGGAEVSLQEMHSYLQKEDEPGYKACTDKIMAHFLNGLIFYRRGRDPRFPAPEVEKRVTNNVMLKKLRVAFELKTEDLQQILKSVDFAMSENELSAFFRKEGHKNYRECGDQVLRYILKGLAERVRKSKK
ncbi:MULTISPECIES: DUF1456 family protein [Tatumella]|uniref:DUF1456 family protein n=1 Tax=Tatumella punctata TaxID=399969 RepID=A0ABW1VMK2_9GAMM|nr:MULTISPECIES: DUF1456 family protein [unclassified Tatumella]MBS0856182.1 DUF1456 family protein [Tatumella sp. JGM16]MBS0877536.1 DUF1456 family protein [Tatumella sp. JGM82]MBS0891111.1 DUF1456 family protein [Tatumella sp. JGM94]MBS0893991.1 DUF1456 family protein [Tatumella sp. JGM130]MBS0902068.1 DUF1456 family protein [Tatumella sp. JGM100]